MSDSDKEVFVTTPVKSDEMARDAENVQIEQTENDTSQASQKQSKKGVEKFQSAVHKLTLNKRLSGMPLMVNDLRKLRTQNEETMMKLREIIGNFPDPPTSVPSITTTPTNYGKMSSAMNAVSSGWSSLKGFGQSLFGSGKRG